MSLIKTEVLERLENTLNARKNADPTSSYTAKLFAKAPDSILKKIGEECAELIMAPKDNQNEAIIYASADVLYHVMVLLASRDLSISDVINELERREGVSGIAEKNARGK